MRYACFSKKREGMQADRAGKGENMEQDLYVSEISDLTERAMWELRNVISCVPDEMWDRKYGGSPMWQHIYHTLSSLDRWYINPDSETYEPPSFDVPGLGDLNAVPEITLTRAQIDEYAEAVFAKIRGYIAALSDDMLTEKPENCRFTRFRLILGQFRHLHTHMGIIMGYVTTETGKCPYTLGNVRPVPDSVNMFF